MSRLEVEESSFYIAFMVNIDKEKLKNLIDPDKPSLSEDEDSKNEITGKKSTMSLEKDMPNGK
jgi:hypothetical protein